MSLQISKKFGFVNCIVPLDINGAATAGDEVNTKLYDHVTFVLSVGNIGANATLIVEECTSAAGAGNTARAFNYRKSGASGGATADTYSALTAATAAGITLAAASDDNKVVIIEVDAAELTSGSPFVRVYLTPGAAATLVSCIGICSGPRNETEIMPSAIS